MALERLSPERYQSLELIDGKSTTLLEDTELDVAAAAWAIATKAHEKENDDSREPLSWRLAESTQHYLTYRLPLGWRRRDETRLFRKKLQVSQAQGVLFDAIGIVRHYVDPDDELEDIRFESELENGMKYVLRSSTRPEDEYAEFTPKDHIIEQYNGTIEETSSGMVWTHPEISRLHVLHESFMGKKVESYADSDNPVQFANSDILRTAGGLLEGLETLRD